MLLFNGQNNFLSQNKYSIESYEPIDLKPEEQKQNNSFIRMAFTCQKFSGMNSPNMKINNKRFTKLLTPNNNMNNNNINRNHLFQFNKKNLFQAFNSVSNNQLTQNIKAKKIMVPVIECQINQLKCPQIIQNQNIKCNSANNVDLNRKQIIINNNNMINNKILLPNNHLQASPNLITKKISYTANNVPVYRKIIYRRKNVA